jgi:hypothetical protein
MRLFSDKLLDPRYSINPIARVKYPASSNYPMTFSTFLINSKGLKGLVK